MKKVCLVTPGHISTNPRLVKESIALSKNGYQVHIIFTQYVSGQIRFDEQILNDNPDWSYNKLDWTGHTLFSKFSRFARKSLNILKLSNPVKLNRNFYWQLTKAITANADLYIAHNLGALPVAVYAAKKNSSKCGFDAEDFHRYETTNDLDAPTAKLTIAIENKYIPQVDYVTASSPLISERYSSLYNLQVPAILNVFPKAKHIIKQNTSDLPLQLFWFSQTIGQGRGLETVIKAINKSQVFVHLNLLGQQSTDYVRNLIGGADHRYCRIIIHDTVAPDEIFKLAQKFDIGLASEAKEPVNRDICLTNKLFTYIQSGLAVLASNTTAQKDFMDKYPEIGDLYEDEQDLSVLIIRYNSDRAKLLNTKHFCLAWGNHDLNWETEGSKFISTIEKTLAG